MFVLEGKVNQCYFSKKILFDHYYLTIIWKFTSTKGSQKNVLKLGGCVMGSVGILKNSKR